MATVLATVAVSLLVDSAAVTAELGQSEKAPAAYDAGDAQRYAST